MAQALPYAGSTIEVRLVVPKNKPLQGYDCKESIIMQLKEIYKDFLVSNEQCMNILHKIYDVPQPDRQIDFPCHPLETLYLGTIIKFFSTN